MFKRGSISLSINMIVVVVLAFVMLGLMLTLGRNIIDSAGSTAEQVSEQTRQDIINRLIQSNDPLYFTQRQFEIGFNSEMMVMFGIKNTMPSPRNLQVEIHHIHPSTGALTKLSSTKMFYIDESDSNSAVGAFQWDSGPQSFSPGEGRPFDVVYTAPQNVGTYQFRFRIVDADADADSHPVAEQSIFIMVR